MYSGDCFSKLAVRYRGEHLKRDREEKCLSKAFKRTRLMKNVLFQTDCSALEPPIGLRKIPKSLRSLRSFLPKPFRTLGKTNKH